MTAPYTYPIFDRLMKDHKLSSDTELAAFLEVSLSTISRLRSGKQRFNGDMILRVYDMTFLEIDEIRKLVETGPKFVGRREEWE